MSPLSGKTFVLELGRDVRFKAKQELINYLRIQNAHMSYILTASTDYVLVSNDIDTYKTRRAKQLGIPLVNVDYIDECRNLSSEKAPIDIKRFIVTSAEDKENFSKSGTIPVSGGGNSSSSSVKSVKFDLSKIKIWNSDDVQLPPFDEMHHAEIGKWAIFKETNDNSDVYFALELQIIPEEYHTQTMNTYRLRFRYEKQTITSSKGKLSILQYAFSHDINELHQLFASYYYRIATMPRITRIRDLLPDKLGSKLLLRSLFVHRMDTQMLDDDVCQLIESLWIESIGDLNKILSIQPESIALTTIIEAEAALLEIKSESDEATQAATRFYSLIPHQPSFVVDLIQNRRALIDKIDLCQMLRDMLTVNELTNWNIKASIEAKYRALKCHIESIDSDTHEFTTISDMIHSSANTLNEQVVVHHIYSVAKQTDALNFRSTLFNQKQLFHGSKYNNFLGILSRGLLMPKIVVNDLGITRTDFGCLGYGIYFSDSVSTSLKYTTPSTTRPGRRLLCISQVALGDSAKFYSYAPDLIQPPEDFHSTHGVKKTNDNNSKFIDDEYVIYNLDQQRLLYMVEVSWKPFDSSNASLKALPIVRDYMTNQSITVNNEVDIPSTIEDEVIQVAEQDYGLICPSSGQLVPLKAFHIRAQLVDVTAEVVLYQVYQNTSSTPIEAKYVFPLDENCSVCGFEAHINNKIIKGVVKEKEQAKREYREAIEKGHGAYLMHQEQPEVFSVSVGNLPANCEVIIKITYVAELSIENNDIIFRLPAKVASWQSKQALDAKDQTILPSINLEQDNSSMKSVEFSLKASIRMPYEIMKLFSPTHRLRRKITDCLAMIELVDNILLEKDFILSVTLKSINLPRMLNETYALSDENNNHSFTDDDSQACMLTFYPKFEMTNQSNDYVEVVFLIDVSNSMDGKHIQQAKQLAHLFLANIKPNDGNLHFNIVTFGSDNDECFPISSPNTKENIDKAKHFILHSLDHRGNTDLFAVLRQYSLLPSSSKLGRQFILLSDGHINDLQSILTLLENQPSMSHDRFFTCAIGETSNKHQLKQLAHGAHGGGLTTVFDSNYRSRWKAKVLLLLEHIRQPCVTNISIDWHGKIDQQQERFTNQAPKIIRSLFNGMRLTVYRFIQNCHQATLTAMINNQEFVTTVFSNKMTETKGRILHCLTARAIIHDYENGLLHIDESENELLKKQYKQDLIELSMKYSVVSSLTSFVAIEERDGQAFQPGVRLLDVMLEHDIDLLPYISWDGDRSQMEIMKDKLFNAKRLFDSASIATKIDLSHDYENLCQNISYRAGGDAKYDLMLTIIDTYRVTLKDNNKARELEEKMQSDLFNEMNNTTAEEKQILEKRFEEINLRIEMDKLQESDSDSSDSDEEEWEDHASEGGGGGEPWIVEDMKCLVYEREYEMSSLDRHELNNEAMAEMEEYDDEDVLCGSLFGDDQRSAISAACAKTAVNDDFEEAATKAWDCDAEEDEGDDTNFGLFDDGECMSYSIPCATATMSAGLKKAAIKASESDDEGDDMGFGLFDDEPTPYSTTSSKKEEQSIQENKKDSQAIVERIKSFASKNKMKRMEMKTPLRDRAGDGYISCTSTTDKEANETLLLQIRGFGKTSKFSRQALFAPDIVDVSDENRCDSVRLLCPSDSPIKVSSSLASDDGWETTRNCRQRFSPGTSAELQKKTTKWDSGFTTRGEKEKSDATVQSASSPFMIPQFQQQQQQQQRQQQQPAPSSSLMFSATSNAFDFRPLSHSLAEKNIASAAPQISQLSPTNVAPSSFSFANSSTNDSAFFGFGGGNVSDLHIAAPAYNAPGASFSFGPFVNNSNNNNVNSSRISASFDAPSTFSYGAPPPPPPLPAPMAFGSTATNTDSFFAPAVPSQSTSFSFAQPAPPPPPAPSMSGLFGTTTTSTYGPFGSTQPGSSNVVCTSASLAPPPNSGLFGSSISSITNAFTTQSVSAATSMYMPSTIPPPPPPPPAFSFGNTLFSSAKQAFSYGVTNLLNSVPTASSASIRRGSMHRMLESSLTSDELSASTDSCATSFNIQTELDNRYSALAQDESFGLENDVKHMSSGRGGIGSGSVKTSKHGKSFSESKPTSQLREATTMRKAMPMVTQQDTASDSLLQSLRYCDTRCDEQERGEFRPVSPPKQWTTSLSSMVSMKSKKNKLSINAQYIDTNTRSQDVLLLDVTPLGLGIEDANGQMCEIIGRNRCIPIRTPSCPVFTNAYAYQTTAIIRVFRGEHKLTKYNTFMGEFILSGLTPNFASQTLEISISMEIDVHDILHVTAEESHSGAQAMIAIDPKHHPLSYTDLERHVTYVHSNPDYQATNITDRQANDVLYVLPGDTAHAKVSFTGDIDLAKDFPTFDQHKTPALTSTMINELKRIQLSDGSFAFNEELANLLSIPMKNFDELKQYLCKQGFNSFALNIQNDIFHLIATGIILLELFLQVPGTERKGMLVPFDSEQIQSIFHRHLPQMFKENADKALDYFNQKRSRYGMYCEQLEMKYSSWEKFIQYGLLNMEN